MKRILFLLAFFILGCWVMAQTIPYGNNPATGKYLDVGDTKLYYEVYGAGKPLLLLHGDTFGYISEFDQYIPLLASHFRVIAVGMRGHGKSEIGKAAFSYALFAKDAVAVLNNETKDSATVVGFSAGATTAYYLAAYYTGKIKRVVAMAGALDKTNYRIGKIEEMKKLTGDDYEKMLPELVNERKALMPKPNSYNELIEALKISWLQPIYINKGKAAAIKCPVLIVAGDKDNYQPVESFVKVYRLIPGAQLAIIPGYSHVDLIRDPKMFSAIIMPFLLQ